MLTHALRTAAPFAAILLCAAGASAQQRLDISGRPNFGERTITPGFVPDPATVAITSGGNIDVSSLGLADGCTGYATRQPDFNIRLSGASRFFRIYFEGGGQDATLIVNKADGSWACNDDTINLDPVVSIEHATPGLYNVWVGSYSASDRIRGTLKITELRQNLPGVATAQPPPQQQVIVTPPSSGNRLDTAGRPNFGERTLASGFVPDPATVQVTSGGSIDASTSNAGSDCRGWVTSQPDFNVRLTSRSNNLRFYMNQVQGNGDTTLIINTADGRWICNDDSYGGRNPTVDIRNAPPGLYNVWVGSYEANARIQGRLNVTEVDGNHP